MKVYAYYRYETKGERPVMFSIHKTEAGAIAEMRNHKEDGFIETYNLSD